MRQKPRLPTDSPTQAKYQRDMNIQPNDTQQPDDDITYSAWYQNIATRQRSTLQRIKNSKQPKIAPSFHPKRKPTETSPNPQGNNNKTSHVQSPIPAAHHTSCSNHTKISDTLALPPSNHTTCTRNKQSTRNINQNTNNSTNRTPDKSIGKSITTPLLSTSRSPLKNYPFFSRNPLTMTVLSNLNNSSNTPATP
jgi:hypothetical protein